MKNDHTKNLILDTAAGMFWRKSYHGVNMNALSKEAGLNKATVYQYFSSKEELAVAAVQRTATNTEELVFESAINENPLPRDQLKAIYNTIYNMQKSLYQNEGSCSGCPFVNLGTEMATSSDTIRIAVVQTFTSFRKYYQKIVTKHWEVNGRPEGAYLEEIVSSLIATMNGCIVTTKLENNPEAVLQGQARALTLLG